MKLRRGTTPTIGFTLPVDASLISRMWLTIAYRGEEIFTVEKERMTIDATRATYKLTQEETLQLPNGQTVDIQVRILTTAGDSVASEVIHVRVAEILKDGVI